MSHLHDLILAVTGGPTINEGLASYYGKTANESLQDAEYRWLIEGGAAPGHLQDMWTELLIKGGYSGSLNDMRYDFWAAGGIGIPRSLLFAGDTYITIPTGPFDAGKPSIVEYTARMDDYLSNRDVWGTDTGNNYGRWRNTPDFRGFRGGAGGNAATLIHQQGVTYDVIERVDVAGTLQVTFSGIGEQSVAVGATGVDSGPWQIGSRVTGIGFIGIIRDFKIYDSTGQLTNHWPINDDVPNGGEITDIVGGNHGTLVLGSGSWIN